MPCHNVYGVLIRISTGYPPVKGRLHTCYAPVRRSQESISYLLTPRLACIRPAASVHPEPGSNSPLYRKFSNNFYSFSRPGIVFESITYNSKIEPPNAFFRLLTFLISSMNYFLSFYSSRPFPLGSPLRAKVWQK